MFMHIRMTPLCCELKIYPRSQEHPHKQVASISGKGYVREMGYIRPFLSSLHKGTLREQKKGKESETTKLRGCQHTGGINVHQRILRIFG